MAGNRARVKSNQPSRRGFLKIASVAAVGTIAVKAMGQAAGPATGPTTIPAPRPGRAGQGAQTPLPALGNAEEPAINFQAYPGGTGAFLEKLAKERGRAAFERATIVPEAWDGAVPASEEEVAFLPVYRLAKLIETKKLSSVDLTRIYLDRMKRFDPKLLCAVTIMEEQAKEAAQQADAEIKAGKYRGPLHGIPWGVKDLFATKGVPTTWGAKEFTTRVIDLDAELVVRMREAGAVLMAKLATGRFAMGDQWYRGRTNNPWDITKGSSGSSAGPASATVAGCVAFGVGTETRGSIVSPASVCGMTALRPTYGRVSRHGGMTLAWSMDRVGPLCRTAEDCALVFNVLHGVDEKDPSTVTAPFQFERSPALAKLRIGYDRAAPQAFVDKLRELGAEPKLIGARPPFRGMDSLNAESAAAFEGDLTRGVLQDVDSPNGEVGQGRFTDGRNTTVMDYFKMIRRRQIAMQAMATLMGDFDLYVSNNGDIELTSYTGHPAVVLPYAFRPGDIGQPVCVTLIGNLFADDKILSVASAYQRATAWHEKHPKLTA